MLVERRDEFPRWFASKVEEMGKVVDALARSRPKFRYPYEYTEEEHESLAEEMRPKVEGILKDCKKLIDQLFREKPAEKSS